MNSCVRFLRETGMIVFAFAFLAVDAETNGAEPQAGSLEQLRILQEESWPRVFFFRYSERAHFFGIEYKTQQKWESVFNRAMGITGKALDEEKEDRQERNSIWFSELKKNHPDQVVLEYLNGRARAWQYETGTFSAGHWLYGEGSKVLSAIPAEEGITELLVADTSFFYDDGGRQHKSRAEIGLCLVGEDGRPDWTRSEQVQLVSKDDERGILRVKRGCATTVPRAFPPGTAWVAPHLIRGPFDGRVLWKYNFSTQCPRDAKGRNCVDVLVENTAEKFLPGGVLEEFDGLIFDAMWAEINLEADCDGDGRADAGFFDGINTFDLGVHEYLRRLREKLGKNRIIMSDGGKSGHQRGFGVLNGIESEGFPEGWDDNFQLWSAGVNVHGYWQKTCHSPCLNYFAFLNRAKETLPGGADKSVPCAFNHARLTMAAAMMVDAAISQKSSPPYEEGQFFELWDELKMGRENRLGWLGRPLAPARRFALEQPDILKGVGTPPSGNLLESLDIGEATKAKMDGDSIRLTGAASEASSMRFTLKDIPVRDGELLLAITLRGVPLPSYPRARPRLVKVEPKGEQYFFDKPNKYLFSWIGEEEFFSTFYYRGIAGKRLSLEFEIEGGQPVWITSLSAYNHADAFVREYEHGVVLGNPSFHEYTFDLDRLFPSQRLRRLTASLNQDAIVNNGATVSGQITLDKLDGLFLIKEWVRLNALE